MNRCSKDRFPKVYFFLFVMMALITIPSVRQCVVKFLQDRLLPLFQLEKWNNNKSQSSDQQSSGHQEDDFTIRLDLN